MPLMNTVGNSNIFRQSTQPADWQNGDIWIDTSTSPPIPKINDNGTPSSLISGDSDITINGATHDLDEWLFV